ncbi:hypothetical protein ABEV40_04710 [Geobacillus thermocatenulatus]|uniref:hypothetical protein n=1 Tax=Geobacillus thermocatenulatus TaxID=33938 RepID=UPI003D20A19E
MLKKGWPILVASMLVASPAWAAAKPAGKAHECETMVKKVEVVVKKKTEPKETEAKKKQESSKQQKWLAQKLAQLHKKSEPN